MTVVINNNSHLVAFNGHINRKEFINIKRSILSSLNSVSKGEIELYGSSVADVCHELKNARVSDDLDVSLPSLKNKSQVKKLLKGVFEDLKSEGYHAFDLKIKNNPLMDFCKKITKNNGSKYYNTSFKLNEHDPIEYKNIKQIKISFLKQPKEYTGKALINSQNVTVPTPAEFIRQKIMALYSVTLDYQANKPNQTTINKYLTKQGYLLSKELMPKFFKKVFSKSKFFYDFHLFNEAFPDAMMHVNQNENISIIKKSIKNNIDLHKKGFNQKIITHEEVQLKEFDFYKTSLLKYLDKLQSTSK